MAAPGTAPISYCLLTPRLSQVLGLPLPQPLQRSFCTVQPALGGPRPETDLAVPAASSLHKWRSWVTGKTHFWFLVNQVSTPSFHSTGSQQTSHGIGHRSQQGHRVKNRE